jgi:hypothetical protein
VSAKARIIVALVTVSIGADRAGADEVLYRYEGTVVPYDASAGWIISNPCDGACVESLEEGHFVLSWPELGDGARYHFWITSPPESGLSSLWVEWRFRSTRLMDPYLGTCDADFVVSFGDIFDLVEMSGDVVVSFEGGDFVRGLDPQSFHTNRFESADGLRYLFSVDGQIFLEKTGLGGSPNSAIQFGGRGGCTGQPPIAVNEWDFVRFGTVSFGEQIIASDPPSGFLDARQHVGLDRFTVTFDAPNFVYLDQVTVETSEAVAPAITEIWRRENDEPDTVEIVLDKGIAFGETLRFTFDDGVAVNVVEYTLALGDTDGDGDADLHDFALFQTCFGRPIVAGACSALDLHTNGKIDLLDYALFYDLLVGE